VCFFLFFWDYIEPCFFTAPHSRHIFATLWEIKNLREARKKPRDPVGQEKSACANLLIKKEFARIFFGDIYQAISALSFFRFLSRPRPSELF